MTATTTTVCVVLHLAHEITGAEKSITVTIPWSSDRPLCDAEDLAAEKCPDGFEVVDREATEV